MDQLRLDFDWNELFCVHKVRMASKIFLFGKISLKICWILVSFALHIQSSKAQLYVLSNIFKMGEKYFDLTID